MARKFTPRKVLSSKRLIITSEQVIVQGSTIYCQCSKCERLLHLEFFGVRMMSDGVLRNQPQCSECRSD
jgi:NAD-dependent SIR2 family protein deacetylase